MKNNKLMNVTKVVSKIIEVFNWVGAVLMLCATIFSLAKPSLVDKFLKLDTTGKTVEMNTYGLEIEAPIINGMVSMKHVFVFGIFAVIALCLMAMIFRNMNLIIKRSEKESPFCKDNIRMVREIGIFSIAIPVVGIIMSIVATLVFGGENVETSNNMFCIFMGIMVLGLNEFFIHGAELEEDVEGLV